MNRYAPGAVALRDLAELPAELLEVAYAVADFDMRTEAGNRDLSRRMDQDLRELVQLVGGRRG